MSYCRWSSDDWTCDVYVYESTCGFTIHVAGARHVGDTPIPKMPELKYVDGEVEPKSFKEWFETHQAQMRWLDQAPIVPIHGPFDSETFYEPTADDCANKLEEIRGAGYNVPQYVLDALRSGEDEE